MLAERLATFGESVARQAPSRDVNDRARRGRPPVAHTWHAGAESRET
jgi:hypothetical protein